MRAIILGGTGAIGGATALRLASRGWDVDVTGRHANAMPGELRDAGVAFHAIDRADTGEIATLMGEGAELLVDAVAYSARDVRALLPVMSSAASTVLISSRAVYVDSVGRHINGDERPRFELPIREDNRTLPPAGDEVSPFTREGYAPSKVAAENTALDSGLPVTVIRPSKVHGRWARNPRTRSFVTRMLRGEPVIALADRGESVDHLTAAVNTAALIETVALRPGRRILNSADPDGPTAAQIVAAVGEHLGWSGRLDLLPAGADGGEHPWHAAHPIVLDTSASLDLGYRPIGTAIELLGDEAHWCADVVRHETSG
ncbi:Nucleoside-diphosphate-sugar epimerase [Paramicrobacterium humi]|uniref:Nucleoside-diphosphate-sugar epimerase n=1 Tax=Paramicrobacterium humi TaxID=640635 RepID=A0A1H4K0N8_9MICO|nr:NAD-dependent epimerase/dehydratase family protein [Microbacterium humi]SEB51983.1 Nucleoside-diphosphate-sugar epimerase [Microbacterium humi]